MSKSLRELFDKQAQLNWRQLYDKTGMGAGRQRAKDAVDKMVDSSKGRVPLHCIKPVVTPFGAFQSLADAGRVWSAMYGAKIGASKAAVGRRIKKQVEGYRWISIEEYIMLTGTELTGFHDKDAVLGDSKDAPRQAQIKYDAHSHNKASYSEEHRAKISKALTGIKRRPKTDAEREAARASSKKMWETRKRTVSPEARAKMSASAKARWGK